MGITDTQVETKPEKGLVEDFWSFSISQLGRGILHRRSSTMGGLWFDHASWLPNGSYRIRHQGDESVVVQIVFPSPKRHLPTSQDVRLEAVPGVFGKRPYFRCPSCESRRNILQISRVGRIACRGCLNLVHLSTRESHQKRIFHTFGACIKLLERQSAVRRVVYAGRYTRKAKSILHATRKVRKECRRI